MPAPSFEHFLSTRRYTEKLPQEMQICADCVSQSGYIYDDCCYIEVMEYDGCLYLMIENQQWVSNDLSYLEELLYKNWYVHAIEITG